MSAEVRIDGAALAQFFNSPQGPVVRELAVRAERVRGKAAGYVGRSDGPGPHIQDAMISRPMTRDGMPGYSVGCPLPHALYAHDDTIPHDISSKSGKTLVFEVGGVTVFVPPGAQPIRHPGTTGTKYLERAASDEGFQVVRN